MVSGKISAENVYIFISDSLRFDHLPDRVSRLGRTFRTVASSTFTAPSVPAMFTGRYPVSHGVFRFEHRLRDGVRTLFDLDGDDLSISYSSPTVWVNGPNPLHDILGVGETRFEDLEPPFVHVEHDKGGHCPYGYEGGDYDGSCGDSFLDFGRKGVDLGGGTRSACRAAQRGSWIG